MATGRRKAAVLCHCHKKKKTLEQAGVLLVQVSFPYHGCNLVKRLQVSDDLGLVSRLNAGKASCPFDGFSLRLLRKIIKLAACIGLSRHVLVLSKDADPSADGHGRALVVPCDHDNTDTCLVAQFH